MRGGSGVAVDNDGRVDVGVVSRQDVVQQPGDLRACLCQCVQGDSGAEGP